MRTETIEYCILEHFLAALINGDETALSDEEQAQLEDFYTRLHQASKDLQCPNWHLVSLDGRKEWARCEITSLMGQCCTLQMIMMG